mmetsp:Transcript_89718/g.159454  ORF Transcript_89718/g.159454 Transcript_89718/m.159454 type:complete len:936 (+) Transcript_89718:90-2897(+)|eukprot:CAMPEP_0197630006 /NCGR_PEP_ID=MMETSP1338-20131121/7630_1 /TAXON_ID=43686 ORGANISM="Pelagodinium beii, Strain RCC1491" /NCGR_SAMPLE_ID=MMETSP1338 /ASSEMBLY_ACC=CAM_ASM_000754 /LENGTH=935 /DNA_ID=CAMNT_0043201127 /DNA_START=90 /DNA_END=2897 /DNA_ORIENTATION=+
MGDAQSQQQYQDTGMTQGIPAADLAAITEAAAAAHAAGTGAAVFQDAYRVDQNAGGNGNAQKKIGAQEVQSSADFCEPALLSQLVQLLGQRQRHSLLLSDLGALLPGSLRHGVKEKGGLRSWLQKYPELFQVSGLPGKESVTLLLGTTIRDSAPRAEEASGAPAPVGPQHAQSAAELEHTKRMEDEENESAVQLRGLPYRATVQDVKNFLGQHARNLRDEQNSVQLVLNRDGRPSGFGRVQFTRPEAARAVRDTLHMHVMEVAGAPLPNSKADKEARYVEIFLYSERPNKLRFKKTVGDSMETQEDAEIEALGVTKQQVIEECRLHMNMPGKGTLLLSMLGVALSPPSRLYLKKTDQGLKHFLAQYPDEFSVDGTKGRECIVYHPAMRNGTMNSDLPANYNAVMAATKPDAQMMQAPAEMFSRPAVSSSRMGPPSSAPLPVGSVGSSGGGSRRGSEYAGSISDLKKERRHSLAEDTVPQIPESPKVTYTPNLYGDGMGHINDTPLGQHPGMQTPSDWGSVPPTPECRGMPRRQSPGANGTTAAAAAAGAGTAPAGATQHPNLPAGYPLANWSAWAMPPACWPPLVPPVECQVDGLQAAFAGWTRGMNMGNTLPMPGASATPDAASLAAMVAAMNQLQNPCANPWAGLPTPGVPAVPEVGTAPAAEQPDVIQMFLQQAQQAQEQMNSAVPPAQLQELSPNPAASPDAEYAAVRLRGLPYDATEQDVLAWFAKYEVVEHIADSNKAVRIFNKNNGKPMGLAVVMLNSREDANYVVQTLSGQTMGTRYIEVFHHTEGEAGTDKAIIRGTTGGTSGTPQASQPKSKASPEVVNPSPFDGASDTGGSGGSGAGSTLGPNPFPSGWPQLPLPTGFPGFPGIAPPFTPAPARETDPNWEALFGFLKDPMPMPMPPADLAALGQVAPTIPSKDNGSNLRMDSM